MNNVENSRLEHRQVIDSFSTSYRQLFDTFSTSYRQLFDTLSISYRHVFDKLSTAFRHVFRQVIDTFSTSYRQLFDTFFDKLSTAFRQVIDSFSTRFRQVFDNPSNIQNRTSVRLYDALGAENFVAEKIKILILEKSRKAARFPATFREGVGVENLEIIFLVPRFTSPLCQR